MTDGFLMGVLIFLAGLLLGGGAIWAVERWHEEERLRLYQVLGEMQHELDTRPAIPEEEM